MKNSLKKITTLGFAFLLAVGAGIGLASKKSVEVKESKADSECNVYWALPDNVVTSGNSFKCNVKRGNDDWQTVDMTRDGSYKYHKKQVFKATFTEKWGGLDVLQFQCYSSGAYSWQDEVFTSWTTKSVFDGKIFENGSSGWHTYQHDTELTSFDIYIDCHQNDWSSIYAYSYENYQDSEYKDLGDYWATQLNNDPNLRFGSDTHKLEKITVKAYYGENAHIMFHNQDDSNKCDIKGLENNMIVYHNGSEWTKTTDSKSEAAVFVFGLNKERLAVPSSGSIKQYSICGLSALKWVSAYDSLSSDAKTIVNESSIYTYKDASSTGADTRVSYSDIIAQLRIMNNGTNSTDMILGNISDNTQTITCVTIISIISILGCVGFFFYRKKKLF